MPYWVTSLWMCLDTVPVMLEGEAELKTRYEEVLSKLRPEQRQKVQGQVESKGMSWMSVVPHTKESFDLSAQQWRDRVHLQCGWDLQGLPE